MQLPPTASDGRASPDAVDRLVDALARIAPNVPAPPPSLSPTAVDAYLGDAVAIVYRDRSDAQRLMLLGRLTALADAAAGVRGGAAPPSRPGRRRADGRGPDGRGPDGRGPDGRGRVERAPAIGLPPRLERTLRRWERLRRTGAAGPRPRADELRARLELLASAVEQDAVRAGLGGTDIAAIAVAELVAQELLAGPVEVERGMQAVRALEPVAATGRALLRGEGLDTPPHVFARPGATLAHLDHLLWLLESIAAAGVEHDDLPAARDLWIELAAALVFVGDARAGRTDRGGRAGREQTWSAVLGEAADLLTLGRLDEAPEAYDWRSALAAARSAALRFAAVWLDDALPGPAPAPGDAWEERPDERRDRDEARLREAAARALLGAWSAEAAADRQRSS